MAEIRYIPCKISMGLFEDERMVEFHAEGTTYRLIVDKDDVQKDTVAATEGEWVDGLLTVYVIKIDGETVLINLPSETAFGRRLSVPEHLLQETT